eukprot:1156872-Pelagomonas_calceolata.AAC.4
MPFPCPISSISSSTSTSSTNPSCPCKHSTIACKHRGGAAAGDSGSKRGGQPGGSGKWGRQEEPRHPGGCKQGDTNRILSWSGSASGCRENVWSQHPPVFSSLPQLHAPLNDTKLREEADDAYCTRQQQAPASQHQSSGPALLVAVQVPGSVEEVRLCSKPAFIKNDRRNRLEEQYLNACLTFATQRMWEFEQFPLERAKWAAKQHYWTISSSRSSSPSPSLMITTNFKIMGSYGHGQWTVVFFGLNGRLTCVTYQKGELET